MESPFELTDDEWAATRVALHEAKRVLDPRLRPDGYNLLWNVAADAGQVVAHVHLHVIFAYGCSQQYVNIAGLERVKARSRRAWKCRFPAPTGA